MPSFTSKSLLTALVGAASVAAHGHVTNIVINGDSYQGYDINSFPYSANPPVVVGWTASNTDNGFVAPDAFSSADIICHRNSANAKGHAVVKAGDKISIQWDTWPESHHGPVIDYLANCGAAGCETVEKTALEFFKIDEVGLVDGSAAPGKWGSDQLIENGNSWLVQIPENIAPGFYVLRHEIIALHSAGDANGAQNYPQCFNLQVTGSGTEKPAGVKGTELYTPNDEGIRFNIYRSLTSYPVPGPAPIKGAVNVQQARSAITASATALTGLANAPVATAAPATTTAAAPAATTTSAVVAAPTTTLIPSTTKAVTVAPTTTTAAPQATQPAKGGCRGGRNQKKRRAARRAAAAAAREAALARRHARDVAFLD
ncbi:glycosyl hydrolase family 61-domain-containing protein [Sordaria brevicollis]|uniref:lytic cellulose monooxygenase (C4-dehydrogenating) n=1 Tax=Sordaria brevicollis TaxID=83679 RepID=A0AAE0UFK7_SORBR|nr:glycosyl hydrolase family 61-domain-containing protein [Sordaria brevicollis]